MRQVFQASQTAYTVLALFIVTLTASDGFATAPAAGSPRWQSLFASYGGWPHSNFCFYQGDLANASAGDSFGAGCGQSHPKSLLAASSSTDIQAQAQNGSVLSCIPNPRGCGFPTASFATGAGTFGSPVTVNAGAPVTLEWSCMGSENVTTGPGGTSGYGGWCSGGCGGGGGGYTAVHYSGSAGTNFNTGGALSGAVVVNPVATTTYTLTCIGANPGLRTLLDGTSMGVVRPNSVLAVTVNVIDTDPCPTPLSGSAANGWQLPPGGPYRLNGNGHNACLTNTSGNSYFIPGHSNAETDSFFNNAARLGVTVN